jgi:hypothetical protein
MIEHSPILASQFATTKVNIVINRLFRHQNKKDEPDNIDPCPKEVQSF